MEYRKDASNAGDLSNEDVFMSHNLPECSVIFSDLILDQVRRSYCGQKLLSGGFCHGIVGSSSGKKTAWGACCTNQCCLETYLIEIILTKLTNSVLALSWNEAVNEEAVKRLWRYTLMYSSLIGFLMFLVHSLSGSKQTGEAPPANECVDGTPRTPNTTFEFPSPLENLPEEEGESER